LFCWLKKTLSRKYRTPFYFSVVCFGVFCSLNLMHEKIPSQSFGVTLLPCKASTRSSVKALSSEKPTKLMDAVTFRHRTWPLSADFLAGSVSEGWFRVGRRCLRSARSRWERLSRVRKPGSPWLAHGRPAPGRGELPAREPQPKLRIQRGGGDVLGIIVPLNNSERFINRQSWTGVWNVEWACGSRCLLNITVLWSVRTQIHSTYSKCPDKGFGCSI